MRVVDAQGTAALAVAQAHPGADALDPRGQAAGGTALRPRAAVGRLVRRLLQPESAAVEALEAVTAEVDGAVLAAVTAVVAADADALVSGQRLLQEGDLP